MPTREEVIEKWKAYMSGKADVQMYRPAMTGDGSTATTCDVAGKPGWAWVRYNEKQDRASQVANMVMPGAPQGLPVMIGKKYPTDNYYQILGVNQELYYEHASPTSYLYYLLPKHGETHQYESSDPAWISLGNLLPGSVAATSPASMFVTGYTLIYEYAGTARTFGGGVINLTSTIPGVAGTHRYVLITIDPDTNLLDWTMGDPSPLPVVPGIPAIPLAHIPLAVVMVTNGDTSLPQSDIYQYKYLFGSSAYLYWINQIAGAVSDEMDIELTLHEVGG